jgi:hypothetical protein
MKLPVVKIFLSFVFLALTVVNTIGYACDFSEDSLPTLEIVFLEIEAEPESTCYVDPTETVLGNAFPFETCHEENDGDWATNSPEGVFSQDHPDEQAGFPPYLWKATPPNHMANFFVATTNEPAVHSGANYPPPQH